MLLLGRCVGDSLGVFAYLCQVPFDASSLLNVNCEEVVGSIIVVTTLCACAAITLFINHLYNIQLLLLTYKWYLHLDTRVIPKVSLCFTPISTAFAPYPLFQWHLQRKEISLNLGMKC